MIVTTGAVAEFDEHPAGLFESFQSRLVVANDHVLLVVMLHLRMAHTCWRLLHNPWRGVGWEYGSSKTSLVFKVRVIVLVSKNAWHRFWAQPIQLMMGIQAFEWFTSWRTFPFSNRRVLLVELLEHMARLRIWLVELVKIGVDVAVAADW